MKKRFVLIVVAVAFVYGYLRGHEDGVEYGHLKGTRQALRDAGFDEEAIWRQTT